MMCDINNYLLLNPKFDRTAPSDKSLEFTILQNKR